MGLLVVLPTGYGKMLIFSFSFLCCSRKELEIIHHMLVVIINDQIMKVEVVNLTACNLVQKLVCSLGDIKEDIEHCVCIVGKCHR